MTQKVENALCVTGVEVDGTDLLVDIVYSISNKIWKSLKHI